MVANDVHYCCHENQRYALQPRIIIFYFTFLADVFIELLEKNADQDATFK